MQLRSMVRLTLTQRAWRALGALYVMCSAALALAEGGGGGAIDGNGGSGPEPGALALFGVAAGVGLLLKRRPVRGEGQAKERS